MPIQKPDRNRDAIGDKADDQRGAGAVEQAGEQVAAERIGAEQELGAWRHRRAFERQPVKHLFIGIIGCNEWCGDRHENDEGDDRQAEQRRRLADHAFQDAHQPASGMGSAPPRMEAAICSIGMRRRIAQLRRIV